MPGQGAGRAKQDKVVTGELRSRLVSKCYEHEPTAATAIDAEERLDLFEEFAAERKRQKLSQSAVAERMSTTQSAISELEQGIVEPRLSTLQRYARILGFRFRFKLDKAPFYEDRRFKPELPQVMPAVNQHSSITPVRANVRIENVDDPEFECRADSRLARSLAVRLGSA